MTRRICRQILSREVPPLLEAGASLVDIRRPEEWVQTGVVAGSQLLTFFDALGDSRPELWMARLDALIPRDQPLLLL